MSELKRYKDLEGLDGAESVLNEWLRREDVEVVSWQIVPYIFPYYSSSIAFSLSWKHEVELFIQYIQK